PNPASPGPSLYWFPAVRRFARPRQERSRWSWLRRSGAGAEEKPGSYLDGGFGVGKTHLLASLWHEFELADRGTSCSSPGCWSSWSRPGSNWPPRRTRCRTKWARDGSRRSTSCRRSKACQHFDVRRIDGRDYRHRGLPVAPEPWPDAEVARVAGERRGRRVITLWIRIGTWRSCTRASTAPCWTGRRRSGSSMSAI
ncbi:MAG: cell division protein ZapE, partial [Kribbellaceae bacterium]|nr:cell division protein ZapE [Kribbellaceae bacterium]